MLQFVKMGPDVAAQVGRRGEAPVVRILILLVLGWIIYYSLRGLFSGEWAGRGKSSPPDGVDDVMQPCPEC